MALPMVKGIVQCSDFHKTVLPYIPQLYELPQQILQSYNNPTELRNIYLATNPLICAFAFSIFLVPLFLLVSEINRNYSQVDRVWSILPTVYIAHFSLYAHMSGLQSGRNDHLVAVSLIWSLRLTFNYWRRGGYQIGSEDYRWEILRAKMNPALFFVFNVVFICLAQSILLFLVSMPAYVMLLTSQITRRVDESDTVFARLVLALVTLEFFADQQQWSFQNAKKAYQKTAKVPPGFTQEDLDRGFVVTGLWSWSRHPNFAAEQGVWLVVYQWGCYSSESFYNWTGIGALAYVTLFQGSTWFTELISKGKYPEYDEYQKRVGKFIPRLRSDIPSDHINENPQPKEAPRPKGK